MQQLSRRQRIGPTKSIILNTESIILNTESIILNTKSIILKYKIHQFEYKSIRDAPKVTAHEPRAGAANLANDPVSEPFRILSKFIILNTKSIIFNWKDPSF